MAPLKICFVSSEIAPFAKAGGLADVAQALPEHLQRQGHDVRVFMPFYGKIDTEAYDFTAVDFLRGVHLRMGDHVFTFSVFVARAPNSQVDVYFLHCPQLFHGDHIYTGEWDEHLRFSLLTRGAIECCQRMGWGPDIFHCNDWHTALLPLYLKTLYSWDQLFARSKTVYTIHNIAYQGVFPAEVIGNLGLDEYRHLLFQSDLEQGAISFMKTGVLYADVVTTVSRTYAQEIQTEAYGMGLEALLRQRSSSVVGIVNGVDYSQWSPQEDPLIPYNYGIDDVAEGKERNKQHLCESTGLVHDEAAPMIGVVSRLTSQKGLELTYEALPEALRYLNIRAVILGTGESDIENHFHWLQRTFPQKVCYYRGYNNELAHLIEAGADIFLMPSRFEPCGLNQMYSLKYGTVPIVRKTGGLADTVELFDPATGRGTGFVFEHYDKTGFGWALKTALTTYQDRDAWEQLRRNGMEVDFSWDKQGAEYETLYRQLAD
ncbi:MAG: glycogen synthase GlgA [Acidobacteriota bacterium]